MNDVAANLAKKSPGRPGKQVRLKLVYVSLRSSVVVSLLVGVVLGVLAIVVTLSAWAVLTRTGAFDQLDTLVSVAAGSGTGIDVKSFFSLGRMIALSAAIGLINVIVVTASGTVCALVYNLIVKLAGGLFVGFTSN